MFTIIPQVPPTPSKDDTPRWKKRAEIAAVSIAFGLLVVTTFYACFAKQQRDEMIRQNKISRDALVISQRPWVGMRGFFLPTEVLPNVPLQAKYAQVNSGQGPALRVGNRVAFGILEQELTNEKAEEKLREAKPPNTYTLFPNIEVPAGQASITINNYWLSLVNSGKAWLYYFGDATYRDDFGGSHRTRFCAVYNATTKEFDHCGIFNDAN